MKWKPIETHSNFARMRKRTTSNPEERNSAAAVITEVGRFGEVTTGWGPREVGFRRGIRTSGRTRLVQSPSAQNGRLIVNDDVRDGRMGWCIEPSGWSTTVRWRSGRFRRGGSRGGSGRCGGQPLTVRWRRRWRWCSRGRSRWYSGLRFIGFSCGLRFVRCSSGRSGRYGGGRGRGSRGLGDGGRRQVTVGWWVGRSHRSHRSQGRIRIILRGRGGCRWYGGRWSRGGWLGRRRAVSGRRTVGGRSGWSSRRGGGEGMWVEVVEEETVL